VSMDRDSWLLPLRGGLQRMALDTGTVWVNRTLGGKGDRLDKRSPGSLHGVNQISVRKRR